ncbi:hypothetical protein [Variovorax sp. MHTC-1]|uniref:hypothetical protein n=1 Tax=Variovorax sp. MHTC-1 TaxID=2495593 RepID=UPI000F87C535|nr:hypothetical protein [Variovorax sp. MHTC-1]RST52115.1 hypothetical protein EJI01_16475 [Variovorax sp. MHTC-1]
MINFFPIPGVMVVVVLSLLGCGSAVVREGNPLWQVPIMSQGKCESIAGRYLDKGLLSRQFVDSSINASRVKFSVATGFGRSVPQIPLGPAELRGMNAISDNQITAAQMKNYAAQRKKFDENAVAQIVEIQGGLEVVLYGGDGLPYQKIIVSSAHPDVGCDKERRLVLRESSRMGGAELTPGAARVSEIVFTKLSDGSLEVRRWSRNWVRTMQRPPAKETQAIFLFPPLR